MMNVSEGEEELSEVQNGAVRMTSKIQHFLWFKIKMCRLTDFFKTQQFDSFEIKMVLFDGLLDRHFFGFLVTVEVHE